jgi:beta-mannosidase
MKFLLFLIGLMLSLSNLQAQPGKVLFSGSWEFRKPAERTWHAAEVPGTIHTDLLKNKLIPDPFYRDNEKKVQWIEKEDWEYRALFNAPAATWNKKYIELVFDGLDTYASVYLNGQLIIEADNMFRQWRAEVKKWMKPRNNELRILFRSAVRHDDSLAAISAYKLAGENNRMYSRKAQYHYGWDWGPRLVTCGIWKPVYWLAYDGPQKSQYSWNITQPVKLITETDSAGKSFYFTYQDKPVYIKGANWIPCESFLPRALKKGLYEKLIRSAKEAHINMLRVWGGGIYEDDLFYELCDKYDIMVWQDFMFAGAMYPFDKSFLDNVEEEVRYQVQRLRKYRCIVLWCGNNEIDEAWHNWGWQQQFGYSANDSSAIWEGYKKIFHEMIPRVLAKEDGKRPYWPSSPSIGWGREKAYREGDTHYWGVWWGKLPVEKYEEKVGRFNSEYGMQGFPPMESIRKFTIPSDLDTASAVMRTHQKHPFGYENIKLYIENKFRAPRKFEDLVYVSQLMQADAIRIAIEAHRRNRPYNMGTLFWQWNDCWPVVSWSAVDYYGGKKALFYEVKRSFAPNLLSVPQTDNATLNLYFVSDTVESGAITLEASAFDFHGNKKSTMEKPLAYQFTKGSALNMEGPKGLEHPPDSRGHYWLYTIKKDGKLLAEAIYLFKPPKQLDLEKTVVSWKLLPGNRLELLSGKFAYGVYIELPEKITASDNYFHLLPGRKKMIQLSGSIDSRVLEKQIKIKSLADTY